MSSRPANIVCAIFPQTNAVTAGRLDDWTREKRQTLCVRRFILEHQNLKSHRR